MNIKSHLTKVVGLGVVLTALSAGAALAAVATTTVNVRSGPGTSHAVIGTLYPGEPVAITGHSGGWCAVDLPGPNGWVSCAYLDEGPWEDGPVYMPAPSFSFGFGFGGPGPFYPHHRPHMHWWR